MLTDTSIRKAKPRAGEYKLSDSGGLYLLVTPAGGRLWRLKYRFGGKEKKLAFGAWPDVSLADARKLRDEARAVLAAERDPAVDRRQRRALLGSADDSFEKVARAWHKLNAAKWTPVHATQVLHTLERDVFPELGSVSLNDITPPMVLEVLRAIEARRAIETAHRVRQRMSAVFVYGIAAGIGANDPAAIVQKALAPTVKGRQPAITDLDTARKVIARVEATPAHPVTRLAHRLLLLTSVRPGEVQRAPRDEFVDLDGDKPLWVIPAARMKMRYDHLVPLSSQAVEVIKLALKVSPRGLHLFPSARHAHRHMSENAMGYLLNRAGYYQRHVPHGWRATFSTIMNERYRSDRQIIDLMLAHGPDNEVEAAYNRAAHLERRRELAQIWSDLILSDAKPALSLLDGPRKQLSAG